ncbi:MAG: hypothetical protein ACI8UO_003756 [Verrucomicrobiales bacterium]
MIIFWSDQTARLLTTHLKKDQHTDPSTRPAMEGTCCSSSC